jgi:hypothetical protein
LCRSSSSIHFVQFVNALKNGGAPFLAEPKPSIADAIVDAFSSLTRPLRSLLEGGRLFEVCCR